jgi:hypothetical protein
MNKKWAWLLGIIVILPVFGACASKPVIFDENLPLEQSARLFFYYGLEITTYNGISVPQKQVLLKTTSTWHDMYLPPGEMEFMLNVDWSGANIRYTASNVLFNYKFEAGKNYTITFTAYGGSEQDKWGVRIYDSPPPNVGFPKSESFIAFVPFYKR